MLGSRIRLWIDGARLGRQRAIAVKPRPLRQQIGRPTEGIARRAEAEMDGARVNGEAGTRSLEGLHGTVPVPPANASFWRHYRAFVGPALLVSVGYMDPGNW